MIKLDETILEILDIVDVLRVAITRAKGKLPSEGSALSENRDRELDKRIAVVRSRLLRKET